MRFSLLPTMITDAVTDLSPELLQSRNVRLLMLDFDNTIVPYTTNQPTQQMQAWLEHMKASEISMCVVSNSRKDRVKIFCKEYGIDCITHANKPFPKGIRQCLAKYQIPAVECALCGDQIFTDTLGANGCGVQSVLVKAIHNHNFWLKIRHVAEMPFILMAYKRRIRL